MQRELEVDFDGNPQKKVRSLFCRGWSVYIGHKKDSNSTIIYGLLFCLTVMFKQDIRFKQYRQPDILLHTPNIEQTKYMVKSGSTYSQLPR